MKNTLLHTLFIIIIGLIGYSNSFDAPFYLDDFSKIVDNHQIHNLTSLFESSSPGGNQYSFFKGRRYIGYLSFAINYQLHNLDVTGYHVLNLAIHIINGILLYFLILITFKTPFVQLFISDYSNSKVKYIAFMASLLFVSHPVQTQAVTYIV